MDYEIRGPSEYIVIWMLKMDLPDRRQGGKPKMTFIDGYANSWCKAKRRRYLDS